MYETSYHNINLGQYKFLITGGAGFIGSNLTEYLLKYGAGKVRILDDFSTGSRENIKPFLDNPAFELYEGDIRDIEACRRAVEGMDYISHQAALGSVPRSINDPITTNEVNISGFLNMLVAARDANIKRMIYAASSSTYGDHPDLPKVEDKIGNPLSPYAITKYVNELYAGTFSKVYNFHTIGLRYFNVFGPKQDPDGAYAAVIPLFIKAALSAEAPFINGDGKTSRDFTFVENAVQANIRALFFNDLHEHQVVNIACGESTTLNQLWKVISSVEDVDIQPHYQPEREGDVKHSLADISKVNGLLGYVPSVKVKDGLVLTYSWYKNKKK
ncbi:UDP-N-acetylglucosamine 4-epimerase [Chitinophaga sp. CF118]|uniref:SDR family oxidoreductase n=1 Tax=Chitinophaga sp. CF118 TaxID=1884367 RepID=UPI0008EFCBCE|nr:SDR family oxidoreductase [Chitinophaga sp. CF118]SFD80490.1 UDP-N-acetylglucosamine 4-epimerase [Chitinophaga sp. CF118]